MDSLAFRIIEKLKNNHDFTSEQLGKFFSVSERTIRNRIIEINEEIIKHGGVINSKRGLGFHLEVINNEMFEDWLNLLHEESGLTPDSPDERVNYIIDFLLKQNKYILIDDLSEILYISRNTLIGDLKKAEDILKKYNLSFERKPNYGIKLIGSEIDKRLCIIDYFVRGNEYFINRIKKENDMLIIADILSQEFHRANFVTSIENYQDIRYVFYVSYIRSLNGFKMEFENNQEAEFINILNKGILNVIDKIVSKLGGNFQSINNFAEKLYLAIQIAGRGNIIEGANIVTTSNIDEIIQNMLLELKNGLKIDFSDDFDLLMSLRSHMTAFDIRMKNNIPVENKIIDLIKKEYSFAFALASYACNYLSEYYEKVIIDDEVGFIALIFETSLERKNKPVQKKNVVIVCVSGNATSRFFVYKYKELFGKYLDKVYECTALEIEKFDFIGKKIDYCFSTIDKEFNIPVPCYRISIIPSDTETQKYKEIFSKSSTNEILKYYDRELFIEKLVAKDKNQVLKIMKKKIETKYSLPKNFMKLVMERDNYGMTSFGGLVATPHPSITCTLENIVCVAVLDKPINWGDSFVQIVILLSLSMDENQDSSNFIEMTTDFISNNEKVNQLINNSTFENLISLLTSNF